MWMEAAHFKLFDWKYLGKPLKISGYRPMSARFTVPKASWWSNAGIYKILARKLLNNLDYIFWNLKHDFFMKGT
jgi:hypothetical protein